MVTGCSFACRARLQQLFLGHAAVGPQRQMLAAVDLRALLGQSVRHHARQGQIHVVAAQQNVLAHRHAVQREFAVRLRDRNQREIRGAAADIHHQDEVAHRHALAPVRMALQPRVEGRLRLFQQGDVLIAGLPRGVQGQFARHRVEGCRDGDQHLLRLERRVRASWRPRPAARAPGSGGWPPPARFSPRLPARGTEAGARCGPPPNATASSWPTTPGGPRSPRRVSAPGAPPQSRAIRPTGERGCRPGSPWRPADRGTRAAGLRRALRPDW